MTSVWIIGRKAVIAANGHEYITEPFIAFPSEAEADEACEIVERVSGERPMKVEASYTPRRRRTLSSREGGDNG